MKKAELEGWRAEDQQARLIAATANDNHQRRPC